MTTRTLSYYPYRTPYGVLTICVSQTGVAGISFGETAYAGSRKPSDLGNRAINELLEYFAGKRRAFDVPLDLEGSDFQQAVWDQVRRIPYGRTATNADIAEAIGGSAGFRTVGAAVKRNPAPIIVPTHRVIGANGRALPGEAAPEVFAGLRNLERAATADEERK